MTSDCCTCDDKLIQILDRADSELACLGKESSKEEHLYGLILSQYNPAEYFYASSSYVSSSASSLSASRAATHPVPAEVMAWRYFLS